MGGWHQNTVALTGSSGCGKSSVSTAFADLGAGIIDADELARKAVASGSSGLKRVIECFGSGMLTAQEELDRKKMGSLVFSNREARRKLEAIIHPIVAEFSAERYQELAPPLLRYHL